MKTLANVTSDTKLASGQLHPLAALVLAAIVSTFLAAGAEAQVCSPNLTFRGNASYTNEADSGLTGTMYGSVSGRVENGELTSLTLRFDPYVSGTGSYGARLFTVGYRKSPERVAPNYYCIPWVNSSVVMIIENVPTAQIFYSVLYGATSVGTVDVAILFTADGPGQIIVDYNHNVWSKTPRPSQLPFWGRLINSRPHAGSRLSITNLR